MRLWSLTLLVAVAVVILFTSFAFVGHRAERVLSFDPNNLPGLRVNQKAHR